MQSTISKYTLPKYPWIPSKIVQQIIPKPSKNDPKSIKISPWGALGANSRPGRRQVHSKDRSSVQRSVFWRHGARRNRFSMHTRYLCGSLLTFFNIKYLDLGWSLGSILAHFAALERAWNLNAFLIPKREASGGENHVFTWDSCKKRRFLRTRNFMKNGSQNCIKS